MNYNFDFLRSPGFLSLLIGLLVGGAILFFAFTWAETTKDDQLAKISKIEKTIEATRPPADNPETAWQKTMKQLERDQKYFWGRRIIRYANLLPSQCQLTSIHANTESFQSHGIIFSKPLDLRLSKLGKYVLSCLDDPILTKNQGPFYIINLERTTPVDVRFALTASMQ
jgi:hypothetical protein